MDVTITFLGGVETVTGSTYLVDYNNQKILVDSGIFQGSRTWRERNWQQPHFDPAEISAVLLTHAHIDHIGMLPRYFKQGLKCPVYASPATTELASLLLPDSGRLQEEEASYRAMRGKSRHSPPLPLYTEQDANKTLELFKPVPINRPITISDDSIATWTPMGHILGGLFNYSISWLKNNHILWRCRKVRSTSTRRSPTQAIRRPSTHRINIR